jgi:D-glycero-alpha-D-manno-heptose-7-phosphate kinase
MVISRTPFRISFFGGGTDYPAWYRRHPGATLSVTIDKYCYLTCGYLPPFFGCKYRIVYSKREMVKSVGQIQHPAVRETLRFLGIKKGISVQHVGDVPARSGIGSSSAFTVGLLNAMYAVLGKMVSKKQLAMEAVEIEQKWMKENVGSQDQVITAFGGLNHTFFKGERNIEVTPVTLDQKKMKLFHDHLMLYFTGFSRLATEIAGEQIKNIPRKTVELKSMYQMVGEALGILSAPRLRLDGFGRLLHESWKIKRTLSSKITTSAIDEAYCRARRAGALGGKILGAGGGGFMLLFVRPDDQPLVRRAMRPLLRVPFKFDDLGSQIIYYRPDTNF